MTAPSGLARRLVRRRTESQMNSYITVLRGALGTLNATTGVVGGLGSATVIYAGKARIHTVSGAGPVTNSGGPIEQRTAIVSIPMNAAIPHRDDVITVRTANRDPDQSESDYDLDPRVFRVLEVDGGAYFGDARRLSCCQSHDSRYWSPS